MWDLQMLLKRDKSFVKTRREILLEDERVVSWCLAVVLAALSLIHAVAAAPGEASILFVEAASATLLLVVGYVAVPRRIPQALAHPVAAIISLTALLSSVLHAHAVRSETLQFNILLVILGSGMFFLSIPWLVLVSGAAVAGWFYTLHDLQAVLGWHEQFPLITSLAFSFLYCYLRISGLEKNEILKADVALAMQNLEQQRNELFDFLDSAHDLVQIVLPDGHFQFVNEAWRNTLGYSLEEARKLRLFDVIHAHDRERVQQWRQELLKGNTLPAIEVRFAAKSGEEVWVEGRVNLRFVNDLGPVTRGIFRDITERRLREAETAWRATHDILTGLPNRSLFMDRCEQALELANRHSKIIAVLFLDLNGFKDINDRYGHDAGDAVLQETAERIRRLLRKSDTVARMGGDEFTILCPEVSDTAAIDALAARIDSVLSLPVSFQGKLLTVSASLGNALFPWDGSSARDLLRTADERMYEAKRTVTVPRAIAVNLNV
jgi:diguanylate cyclase (GGDEF)-like protein/PAS domain S-box-containing protein